MNMIDFSTFQGLLNVFSSIYRFFYTVIQFFLLTVRDIVNLNVINLGGFDPFTNSEFIMRVGFNFPPVVDTVLNVTIRPLFNAIFGSFGIDIPFYVVIFSVGVIGAFVYNAVKNFL